MHHQFNSSVVKYMRNIISGLCENFPVQYLFRNENSIIPDTKPLIKTHIVLFSKSLNVIPRNALEGIKRKTLPQYTEKNYVILFSLDRVQNLFWRFFLASKIYVDVFFGIQNLFWWFFLESKIYFGD
jgi:hypothetical protein